MLKYFINLNYPIKENVFEAVCIYNKIEILEYLWSISFNINVRKCMCLCIENDNSVILNYLYKILDYEIYNSRTGYIVYYTFKNNSINCLKFLYSKKHNIEKSNTIVAIINNSLECLKYIIDIKLWNFEWDDTEIAMEDIPDINFIEQTLKYAIEHGYHVQENIYELIIKANNLELFKAYHKGKPWDINDRNLCEYLAEKGNYDLLKYAHENGAKFGPFVYDKAKYSRNKECIEYIIKERVKKK